MSAYFSRSDNRYSSGNVSIAALSGSHRQKVKKFHEGSRAITFVIARDLVVIELERSPLKGRREGLTVEDERLLPYLSAYIRQANSRGITPELNRDNWRDFARAHQTTP